MSEDESVDSVNPVFENPLDAPLHDSGPPGFWCTKSKGMILIRDMDDDHLKNTIKFLLRANALRKIQQEYRLMLALGASSDGVVDALGLELSELVDSTLWFWANRNDLKMAELVNDGYRRGWDMAELMGQAASIEGQADLQASAKVEL